MGEAPLCVSRTTSEDLIPIYRENGKPSVNARDLHSFLEVGSAFKDWIARRIADFGFSED